MRKLFSVLSLVVLFVTFAFGQAQVQIPITAADGLSSNNNLAVGLDLTATNGIDFALGESDLPPFPPAGVFEARFDLQPYAGSPLSSYWDFRAPGAPPAFPFTGTIQHKLIWQLTSGATTFQVGYTLPTGASMAITDVFGGVLFNSGPLSGTGSYTVPAAFISGGQAFVTMTYTNIGPVGPAPVFEIAPASLNFGSVNVGSNAVLPVTVTNSGTADLTISGISSSNGQFTFAPSAPVTIIPGGNQVFNVTFTPTSAGPKSGNISFTHNATGSPSVLPVSGIGVEPGPTFRVDPTSVNFGNVGVGSSADRTVTVYNDGSTNALNISLVSASPAQFTVTPASANVPPMGSQAFTVTFAPTATGILNGTLSFNHNAPGSPSTVSLAGNGVEELGLIFDADTVYRYENASYSNNMRLLGMDGYLHALQFRLLTNLQADDNTILTFQSIQKGSDVSGTNWILETNVVRGPITSNGASQDTVYVLLYNINATGDLIPGNYNNMFVVNYKVAKLQPLQTNIKSTFRIFNAEGSTFEGFPINIAPSRDILTVIAQAAGGNYGDVNGDGCVDILDLIMVVDHIVGRDSLEGSEFDRANIAPWPTGAPEPTPDAVVNVQDLSLIQNIILTGFYPNGNPVAPCGYYAMPKSNGDDDAKVTIFINESGITAFVDSKVGIRGAQIEFSSVYNDPENMIINTPLGQGYYLRIEDLLRTLMYDRQGQKYIESGYNFMADMPFHITNIEDISIAKLILVDIYRQKIGNISIEINYGTPPLPLDYILFQNYPNPFNPTTAVQFQVPKTSDVTITIYDMLGQEVKTLFAGEVLRGTYTVDWDGFNNAGQKVVSGTYIYRMTAGDFVQSKKMVLIK